MPDKMLIAFIVVIVIVAHVWLYKWVKFKIDEGVILKFLQELKAQRWCRSEAISSSTRIPVDRVAAVCRKSNNIEGHASEKGCWCLSQLSNL